MLVVLEEMERKGYQPDGDSFSLLILVMAETKELGGTPAVLQHCDAEGIRISDVALRRLCVAYLRAGQLDVVDQLVTRMQVRLSN